VLRVKEKQYYKPGPNCGHGYAIDTPHLCPTDVNNINCKMVSMRDTKEGYFATPHVVSRRL
jgi:hypothetical protein